jgi:small nuclear ribonucleoprotein (snRNP)-like protein
MASQEVEEATKLLSEYIGKTLRVHTDDKRVFVGQMKCTDRVGSLPLSLIEQHAEGFLGVQYHSRLDARVPPAV